MSILKWQPAWQAQDVEIKQENLVHNGFFQVQSLHLRHRCFSGAWSPWLLRERICRSDAAAVLLYDTKQDKLVMVEQLRIGLTGNSGDRSPWLLEIVAGLLEPQEDPQETVRREAKEEAGCHINKLIKINDFYNTPGGFAERTYLYCGLVDAPATNNIHGMADENEDIQVHVLPSKSVLAALDKSEFVTSASTVIALQWLRDNKNSL